MMVFIHLSASGDMGILFSPLSGLSVAHPLARGAEDLAVAAAPRADPALSPRQPTSSGPRTGQGPPGRASGERPRSSLRRPRGGACSEVVLIPVATFYL